MDKQKIERLNALGRKQRQEGLTPQEKAEQAHLRQEYLAAMRASVQAQLENMYMEQADGSYQKLPRRAPQDKGEGKDDQTLLH